MPKATKQIQNAQRLQNAECVRGLTEETRNAHRKKEREREGEKERETERERDRERAIERERERENESKIKIGKRKNGGIDHYKP